MRDKSGTGRTGWLKGLLGSGWSSELLDGLPLALALVDPKGNVLRANRRATALWREGPPRFIDVAGAAAEPPWERVSRSGDVLRRGDGRLATGPGGRVCWAAAPVANGVMVAVVDGPEAHELGALADTLLGALPGLVVLTDIGGVVVGLQGDEGLLDRPARLATGRSMASLLPAAASAAWSSARAGAMAAGTAELMWRVSTPDGPRPVTARVRRTRQSHGGDDALVWLITAGGGGDPLAALASEQGVDPVVVLDDAGVVLFANPAFGALVERAPSQLVGDRFARYEVTPGPIGDNLRRLGTGVHPWVESSLGPPDAPHTACGARAARVEDGDGVRYVVQIRDLRHQEAVRAVSQRLKHTDPRTGLPNKDRLMHVLTHRAPSAGWAAVALIGLPDIGDLGPRISETQESTLLKLVARRLREVLPPSVEVVRAAPASLGLFMEDLGGPLATTTGVAADAGLLVQRALDTLSEPIDLHGFQLRLKVAAGVTLCLGRGSRETYREAEFALRRSMQASSREVLRFFDPSLWGVIESEMQLRAAAERALAEARLALHFQPVVNGEGKAMSAEGLLRWPGRAPDAPHVTPMQVIQALEASGKLDPFTDWCVDSALIALKRLDEAGQRLPTMAVNVDAKALMRDDFPDRVQGLLQKRGVDPQRLIIELTEHAVVGDLGRAKARMGQLEALGVVLVQDDFGTGHASLATLHKLPFKALKIDRSFVAEMVSDERAARIVEASTHLAGPLKLGVVAEGVETREQFERLRSLGCDAFQGWHFSRELPVDKLASWLDTHGIAPGRF